MLSRPDFDPDSPTETKPVIAHAVHELVTERLVLVDSQERIRADLRIMDDGEPAIAFYDRHGQERIRLGLQKQWFDDYQEDPPGTEAILKLSGDDNEGHGATAELAVSGTAATFSIEQDRYDDRRSPTAFIEVVDDEVSAVMNDGKMAASFRIQRGRTVLDG